MQQQQPYYPPTPGIGYYTLVLIGIVLLMASGVIYGLLYLNGITDGRDVLDMLRIVLNEVGMGLMAIGLVMGALKDESLNQYLRFGLILAMAIVVAYVHF